MHHVSRQLHRHSHTIRLCLCDFFITQTIITIKKDAKLWQKNKTIIKRRMNAGTHARMTSVQCTATALLPSFFCICLFTTEEKQQMIEMHYRCIQIDNWSAHAPCNCHQFKMHDNCPNDTNENDSMPAVDTIVQSSNAICDRHSDKNEFESRGGETKMILNWIRIDCDTNKNVQRTHTHTHWMCWN